MRFYASKFNTVEIDSTFYHIPKEDTVKRWYKVTPDKFLFTAKFPQTVTHEGSLNSRIDNARKFIDVIKNLNSKLGVLLLQFPYSFRPDNKQLLFELIEAIPKDCRISVELRNKKWLEIDELFDLLKKENISFCFIDHPWMPKTFIKTADFIYIRFLGDRKKIENDFSYIRFDRTKELQYWQNIIEEVISEGKDCFGYFNNHYSGHAPTTAMKLLQEILQLDK